MDTAIMHASQSRSRDLTEQGDRDSRPEPQLAPGTCLQGKYQVHSVLGRGGFAVVYDAEHLGLGRRVALKVLHVGEDTPLALLERFRREARISALVHHPNVLEVYDVGQLDDGSPFLVMERINGENLSERLQRAPLSIAATVELGCQLARGLEAIASVGIVHRDVKPDNIMLHDAGDGTTVVKLVDFGISKHVSIEPQPRLTCHGALVGTPQYMSPEQLRGEEVDTRTDLYALGAVLYECLAGRAPHQSDSFSELVVAVLNGELQPVIERRPNCPPALARIVQKALARSRERRWSSPRALLEALDELACALELPRQADAFHACDAQAPLCVAPARRTNPGQHPLWGMNARSFKLPLQVACVALLALSPKLATHGTSVLHAQRAPMAARVATSSPSAFSPLTPQLVGTRPLSLPAHEFARAELPTGRGVPEFEADAPRASQPLTARRAQATKSTALKPSRATSPLGLEPATAAAAQPEVELSAAQRQSWEAAMQGALSAMVRGRLDAARAGYREASRLAPHEAAGFRGLGLVAARLGDAHEARAAWKRYLALAPYAQDAAAIAARIAALPE